MRPASFDVLPAHAHDVAAPLSRVEQQREREPGTGLYRMRRLKLRDLFLGPE